MPLYWVAILETPTKKDAEEGKDERLILPPSPQVARDEQSAAIAVVLTQREMLPEFDKSRMKVIVVPFA
jgi:hypothetical protein